MEQISSKQIVAGIALVIIGAITGFFLGRYSLSGPASQPPTPAKEPVQTSPLFKSQTATIQGTITKVEGETLTIQDEKSQTGDFKISPKVVIYKFAPNSPQASASSDLSSVETEKPTLLVLELKGGEYQIVSISYLPPPAKPNQ